ncbi:tetratricopeptide repeat protein, partial [Candidatus Neomarinimicrobiota bacterium]
ISKTDEKELLAQIYKSQAEIFLELKQDSIAVSVLEQAAELTRTRLDKGQIYYRLAELAYKIQDYKRAIHHYNNVIKYSFSNDRIMEANLKIVQRYRDLNDLNRASKEIQSMLIDPEFSTIHGDLELELAKLQLTQNNNIAAIQILADIVVKYPNTEISAEAFYMLGEQSLLNSRDFVKADFYYKQIKIEAPKSIFNDYAKKRINELNKYKKSKDFLSEIDNKISKVDSLTVDHVVDSSKIALELYNLGELEAFHFNQIDTSLIYFKRIIEDFPKSNLEAKVIYALGHLYEQLGDTSQSLKYQELIINNYPDSEYADNIRLNNKFIDYGVSGFELLSNVEYLYSVNSDSALVEYKKIADLSNSETSKRALFFIANEYDYKAFDPDSAHKYYNQITIRFPESEQSKIAINRLKYLNVGKIESSGSIVK